MVHKVNTKARIERHLRIYKNSDWNEIPQKKYKKWVNSLNFNIVFFIVVALFPFYPTLASFVHGNSQYEFYRWDIDESSILGSYYWSLEEYWEIEVENAPILSEWDSFLSINTILDDERNLSGTNEIVDYEVQSWESFGSLAVKFQVTASSIMWANGFSSNHVLQPWDIVKIPPVTWVVYKVKSWDTVEKIAKSYNIEASDIYEQNLLTSNDQLKVDTELVLPWAKKKVPPRKTPVYTKPNNGSGWYKFAQKAQSQYTNNKWSYQLVWRKPYSGVAGNCTWYVASYKNVDWRWNANQWLRNARAKWHPTGNTPSTWAIVVLDGRGYNPWYGHVAIVMEVKANSIIVSDMNYRRLYEVTYREIPKNDRAIQWYIYVD